MSKTIEPIDTRIAALACKDRNGEITFIYCDNIYLKDLDFQDDVIRIKDINIILKWFESIIVCTEETLEELKKELKESAII